MASSPRKSLASLLATLVGGNVITILNEGDGWPSRLRVRTSQGAIDVDAYLGPVSPSHRSREALERRFQSPGPNRPIRAPTDAVALLFGVFEEMKRPVIVGLDAVTRMAERNTRQSLFIPLNQLIRAAETGWAEHVSALGDRSIAFTPPRLVDYVELRTPGVRPEVIYDAPQLLLPPTKVIPDATPKIITDIAPKIEIAYAALAARLKQHPDGVHDLTPRQFEILIAELFEDMGWRVQITSLTRDGGADVLAYLDTKAGSLLSLIEAKRYGRERKVGVDIVRSLLGTVQDFNANSGMIVTTSSFTRDAREFRQRHEYRLALHDYNQVLEWIRQYGGSAEDGSVPPRSEPTL